MLEPNRRERTVLAVVVAMHKEFPEASGFTRAAIEMIFGERCAGSLAALAMDGLITQRSRGRDVVYAVTDEGLLLSTSATRLSIIFSGREQS